MRAAGVGEEAEVSGEGVSEDWPMEMGMRVEFEVEVEPEAGVVKKEIIEE